MKIKGLVLAGLILLIGISWVQAKVDPEVSKAIQDFYDSKKIERQQEFRKYLEEYIREQQDKNRPRTLQDRIKDPRLNVPVGEAPIKGAFTAPITMIEFSDFECPYCAKAQPILARLMKNYPNQIKLVFKNNPLPMHPHAFTAAKAAMAASEQGKFWEMHDALFNSYQNLSDIQIEKIAQSLKLDMNQFKTSWKSDKWEAYIRQDQKQALEIKAHGTPSFVVNGVFVPGALPYEQFELLINELLKESKKK